MLPRIYSEFDGPRPPHFLLLHFRKSLESIKKLGVSLREGMRVTAFSDTEDTGSVEVDGTLCYGLLPEMDIYCWYVDIRNSTLRYTSRSC